MNTFRENKKLSFNLNCLKRWKMLPLLPLCVCVLKFNEIRTVKAERLNYKY